LREKATAAALIGVIRAALREWFASEGTLDLVELGTSVFALLEEGVSTSTSDNKKEK
jgi:membrane protein required for beta-lactamase induction